MVEVSFGVGAGAFAGDNKNNAGGGLGGKIVPNSVLVIQNGSSKVVNIKEKDGMSKLIDMVPDLINKFTKKNKDDCGEMDDKVKEAMENFDDLNIHE